MKDIMKITRYIFMGLSLKLLSDQYRKYLQESSVVVVEIMNGCLDPLEDSNNKWMEVAEAIEFSEVAKTVIWVVFDNEKNPWMHHHKHITVMISHPMVVRLTS